MTFLINPFRFAGADAPGILDAYTTNLWACGGMKRMLSSYSGPLLRERRSSDSTEQDIGFVAATGLFDTAAEATFVGANSAFVPKYYDQSGGGNYLQQTTTTKQPRIVNAGTRDTQPRFDGSDDCMTCVNASGMPTAITVFMSGGLRVYSGVQVIAELGIDGTSNGMVYYDDATGAHTHVAYSWNGASAGAGNYTAGFFAGTAIAVRIDRTQVTLNAQANLRSSATALGNPNSTSGTVRNGNFSALTWNFGARNNGASFPAQLNLYQWAIYQGAVSDADCAAILAAML